MSTSEKNIRVTCQGAINLALDELVEFQGGLKKLSKKNMEKLKARILEDGFNVPFFVWKHDGTNSLLDGHQRIKALKSLQGDGYEIPQLPVAIIEASDIADAKKKLLAISSQYGEFDGEELSSWIDDLGDDIADTLRIVDGEMERLLKDPKETEGDDDVANAVDSITELGDVGYCDDRKIIVDIGVQSHDINLGTNSTTGGAGDNGMMFGYATSETEALLPKAMCILQDISGAYDSLRKLDHRFLPDGKAQLTGEYDKDFRLQRINTLTLCYQNTEEERDTTDGKLATIVNDILALYDIPKPDRLLINPTGRFAVGGFDGDAGLTGRKIVVDSYHGFAPVGGGAFSGKDPTKVDRSGAYKAREIAKSMLLAHDLKWCQVQLSYSIGIREPMAIYITSDRGDIETPAALYEECTPSRIIADLGLLYMQYEPLAAFGHFVN